MQLNYVWMPLCFQSCIDAMKGFGIDATGGMEGHWITGRKRMGFYLGAFTSILV